MSKAQCYYEILNIPETATTEEVKQAYKRLALVWHPDKNQANKEEAHAKFQVILKAYETLSDNREREWYDRHKDQILSDGDKDEIGQCINLFQYFSSSCYANFDDSEDGFYTVYRNVFNQLREEEEQAIQLVAKYAKNKSKSGRPEDYVTQFPIFGDSKSSYEDVVRPFYACWSGFCTNLTFDNLDKWNTTEAENRRIMRAMEKENKKVKDAAKKERNANVRNLVEFVRKRDRRLKAHKLLVEKHNELNRQKTAEKQRQQREKMSKNNSNHKQASYLDMDDVEAQLQQLENEYDSYTKSGKRARRKNRYQNETTDDEETDDDLNENRTINESAGFVPEVDRQTDNASGDRDCDKSCVEPIGSETNDLLDDDDSDDNEEDNFSCPACNKSFRTLNAFENHEASKKHKQKVQKLTNLLKSDEKKLNK